METILASPSAVLRIAAAGGMHDKPAGCRDGEAVTGEPGPSMMPSGQALCVDDGPSPAGRIQRVVAPMGRGQPRRRRCVVQ